MSEDSNLVIDVIRTASPLVTSNYKIILNKIKEGYRKITKNGIDVNASIYMTMYLTFKPDYPLESINQHVCQTLKNFEMSDSDCQFKFNNTSFSIIRQFNYSDRFYVDEELDYEDRLSFTKDDEEIFVPLVNGISIYLFPDGEYQKQQIIDGYNLTDLLQQKFMTKYDIKDTRSFLYIMTDNNSHFSQILNVINKKSSEWNGPIKNISYKKNEIKFKNDPLTARIIGEVL